jgi:hypothetical protein
LSSRSPARGQSVIVASGAKKVDINKQGLNSVKNEVVKKNLMGVSSTMKNKNWKDANGRTGKGYGVYKFADKYGANVDGYSRSTPRTPGPSLASPTSWAATDLSPGLDSSSCSWESAST